MKTLKLLGSALLLVTMLAMSIRAKPTEVQPLLIEDDYAIFLREIRDEIPPGETAWAEPIGWGYQTSFYIETISVSPPGAQFRYVCFWAGGSLYVGVQNTGVQPIEGIKFAVALYTGGSGG